MKRLAGLLLLLTVFSLVFVVACGDDDEEEATPTKAAPAATATSKPAAPTAVPTKVMGATPQPGLPTPTAIAQEVPKDSDQAKMGGTVKAIPQASIASLDPQFAGATVSLYTASNVTESAFTRDDSLQVAPMLVDTWEISADQLTWTFTLRSGLKFHNGEPVTAADVIGSYKRTEHKAAFGKILSKEFLESLDVVDDLTFEAKLSEPTGLVLQGFASNSGAYPPNVTSKEIWSQPDTEHKPYLIGAGPFKFVNWEPGDTITIEKWPDYQPRDEEPSWLAGGHTVYVDKVEIVEVPDSAARVAALVTGQVDWVDEYPSEFVSQVESSEKSVFLQANPGRMVWMIMNHRIPPFSSLEARQGVQYAIDADSIMALFAGGPKGRFWDTCPGYIGCSFNKSPLDSNAGAEYYNQANMEKGLQLIGESGQKGVTVRILSPEDLVGFGDYTKPFADLLEDLGFDVDFQSMDWATNISLWANNPEGWEVGIGGSKLGLGAGLSPLAHAWIQTGGQQNMYLDESGRMMELMGQFARAISFEDQLELMKQIQIQM